MPCFVVLLEERLVRCLVPRWVESLDWCWPVGRFVLVEPRGGMAVFVPWWCWNFSCFCRYEGGLPEVKACSIWRSGGVSGG